MCCSRSHYPKEVGLWRTDSAGDHVHEGPAIVSGPPELCLRERDHYHIVLPPLLVPNGTACTNVFDRDAVTVLWSDQAKAWQYNNAQGWSGFLPQQNPYQAQARISFQYREVAERFRDLAAIAIAEGSSVSQDIVQQLLDEFAAQEPDHEPGTVIKEGTLVLAPDPAAIPEWHEWLVQQAAREQAARGQAFR